MIRLPLALVACVSVPLYLLGVLVMAWLVARTLARWPCARYGALGGTVRRSARVAVLAVLWPMWLLVRGCMQWHEYRRRPLGTCVCGDGDPRVVSVQALISARCLHRWAVQGGCADSPADGCEQENPDESWCVWFSSVPAALMATTLGILAALPAPGLGFVWVYAAVTATTVVPLDVLAAHVLRNCTPSWSSGRRDRIAAGRR
ncbi:hypothetical protein KGA66_21490 [Actinocrinis puniceicyclus]|uniref:Uncharacterized protein n=1 Tax=Actinocrinis puniceicyclus TaxID=977794 RepID=A0A8J7WT29_9ACTN|nr:hypothetical protein [Actinocrinis puniceicyclus]MBS2965639.1 hypothetical protein [Actinocrinis puniceicyclus]